MDSWVEQKQYRTHASKIDGTNPRGKVHVQVWNAYQVAKYVTKHQRSVAENCQICEQSMNPVPPNLPVTTAARYTCVMQGQNPACYIVYTTIKCCVCLDDVQPLSSNFMDSWVEQKQYRTPCCYGDLHKQSFPWSPKLPMAIVLRVLATNKTLPSPLWLIAI